MALFFSRILDAGISTRGGNMGKTWKAVERRIARFFGAERNPLSGGNGKQSRSDSLHPTLFIEAKWRKAHSAVTLWRETAAMAKAEDKVPVVCLAERGKEGFWVVCHSSDLGAVADAVQEN